MLLRNAGAPIITVPGVVFVVLLGGTVLALRSAGLARGPESVGDATERRDVRPHPAQCRDLNTPVR